MDWSDFSRKQVGLVGAGRENLGLLPLLKSARAKLTIFENQPTGALKESLREQDILLRDGTDYLDKLKEMDFIFRSPGIPIQIIHKALERRRHSPIVTTATDLFLAIAPCKVVGVTGTKGKGTTANYLFHILSLAGEDVYFAGNVGRSIFDSWDKLNPESIVILELSSFQLEDVTHSPCLAVVLPISEDHLLPLSEKSPNFHPTVEAYHKAKSGISRYQKPGDVVIFAADYTASAGVAEQSAGERVAFSTRNPNAEVYLSPEGRVTVNKKELLKLPISITGHHRQLDATFAAVAASTLGLKAEQITAGLKSTVSLPHRLESYAQKEGILYVDDSYATAPDAAAAALTSFTAPIVWIAGGSSKGASFDELAGIACDSSLKAAVLIGDEAKDIEAALLRASPKLQVRTGAQTMKEALAQANKFAREGDVVLLSPACASFGMFTGAEQRGQLFQQAVDEL